jgi:PGF-pre-PGF domain-containing protein
MKIKGKLHSIALASTILVFVFLILVSAASSAQVTRIGNGTDPAVYGNTVVWTDNGVIHVYDLTAKTDTTVDSSAASYPAIYGNKLVWHDESSGTPRLAVYDIKTATRSHITEDVDSRSVPYIYGNRIVWSANYNETNYDYNVYMHDISTSTQTKIADGNSPDIYDTKIAYGYEDEDGRTIAVYDINTKETIKIHSSSQIFYPHIYGNKVIWSNFYSRDGFIQMYDLVTKETIDVTSDNTGNTLYGPDVIADAGDDTGTHIDINGDKIVYSKSGDDQFGYAGVYVYDIPSAKSTPIHIYPKGTYTTPDIYNDIIVWGIDGKYGGVTSDNGIYVSSLSSSDTLPPVAEFTANVTSGTAPLIVLFTYTGTGGVPASWIWDFGDGINSTHAMNATHTFTKPGSYTVSLTVENGVGNSTVIKTNYIVITDSVITGVPVANFSSNVTEGHAPLAVQFYDSSQNAASRAWDFENDGKIDSSDPNPVYVYTAPGTYFVNLTVTNANGFSYIVTTINVLESGSSGDDSSDDDSSSGGSSHSSSGGSGGGGGSPEPAKNVEVKELCQVFIANGKEITFDFTKKATCVVSVSFDAKKTLGKTTTIAEGLKGKSSLVSELPSGEVYKSFNLWVGNGGVATSKNIENSEVCFKVEKSWVQEKDIDQASVTLNRYSDEKWEQLPVTLSEEDDDFLYFTSETPGFSSFAITGKAKSAEGTETGANLGSETRADETGTGSENSESEQETGSKESASAPGFAVIYGLAGLLAVFLYRRK